MALSTLGAIEAALGITVAALAAAPDWWATVGSTMQLVLVLTLAVGVAPLLLGGPAAREDIRQALSRLRHIQRFEWFLPVHLAGFLLFLGLTVLVTRFVVFSESDSACQWFLAAWTLLGALSLAFWVANGLPEGLWDRLTNNGLDALLFGVAVAVPAALLFQLTRFLWGPLGAATLGAVHPILVVLYHEVIYQPDEMVVGTTAFHVRVHAACGGYEGIGLIVLFLLVYLVLFRRELRWPAALLLFPVGIVLMWVCNVARIVALIAVGHGIEPQIAVNGFHSQAGWLFFAATSLGLIAGSRRLHIFQAAPLEATGEEQIPATPTAPYLLPLLALLATIMLTGAFSADFDLFYPLRFLLVAAVLFWFRAEYVRWDWRPSWAAVALGVGVFFLWLALESLSASDAAQTKLLQGLEALPPEWQLAWIVFRVAGSTITVPFGEELAFRGYLMRKLIGPSVDQVPIGKFTWFSFLVSSALFGAMHGRWLAGTMAGMAYAVALYRRRSLADAILAHAITNGLIAGLVLGGGRWSLWA